MAGDGFHAPQTAADRPRWGAHTAIERRSGRAPEERTSEDLPDHAVEAAVERAIVGGDELARRRLLRLVGVSTIRKGYLQVASLLQLSWLRRLVTVVLPAAAPAIVAGLRISFGSALVAVVPAEMLLGELGVGYLTRIGWNNLHIAGMGCGKSTLLNIIAGFEQPGGCGRSCSTPSLRSDGIRSEAPRP